MSPPTYLKLPYGNFFKIICRKAAAGVARHNLCKSWVSSQTLSKLATMFEIEAYELLKPKKARTMTPRKPSKAS